MRAANYPVKLHYQPTINTCGYGALATYLSYFGVDVTPGVLVQKVPQPTDQRGRPTGSITSQLITWCQGQGLQATLYTFDCIIIDLTWSKLNKAQVIASLEAVKDTRNFRGLGDKHWSKVYVESYISMLNSGAELQVRPYVTTDLLYGLLENGPVYANVVAATLYDNGRKRHWEVRQSELDDKDGTVGTHSLVIYGNDNEGNFLLADPWEGLQKVTAAAMTAGITAAQIESDNMCFQITA